MGQVETTAGPVEASELGRTLVHEHVRTVAEEVRAQWPHLDPGNDVELGVAMVEAVKPHGVQTIVDPACMDLGRSAPLNIEVAERTGIRFVMATGIYGEHYTFLPHFFQTRDEAFMASCFVHDIHEGIQGTEVKAAFLKCAADEPGIQPDVEKIHRAVARASLETGRPIMAHSRPASRTGLDQMKIFVEEGVDPAKVQIAHTGDTDDLDYIEELLATGCFIGLDRFGIDIYLPHEPRIATAAELYRRGHGEKILLGQDTVASFDWFPPEMVKEMLPNWKLPFLFTGVIPDLLEAGVTQEQIDHSLDVVPAVWLDA
jgi:phosphotriesterase-related protein